MQGEGLHISVDMPRPDNTSYVAVGETQPLLQGDKMATKKTYEKSLDEFSASEQLPGKTKVKLGPTKVFVVTSILICELCERLTYYSIVANLILFCTSTLKYSSPDAATISLVFSGVVYFIPVAGGYIADAMAGRYNTILGAGLIYLIGLVMIPASSIDYKSMFGRSEDGSAYDMTLEARRGFFLGGLAFVAIGTGGIKANVGPFGAQQLEKLGEAAVQSFFNWFYWFINAGALVAYSGVAYLQQNYSWAWGFSVPLFSMILALIVFVLARSHYEHLPPGESVLATVFNVWRKGCGHFDRVKKTNGGTIDDVTVDGAVSVLRVLPVYLLMIFYWAIYSQMQSTFFLQAERMNVKVGDVKIPAAMLNIFNTIIILLLIPLVDRLIYPLFEKMGRPLTHLQRMGVGLLLAGGSVVVAGVVEIYRKQSIADHGAIVQVLGHERFNASSMSVFVQIPEYAFVGASEVFASITGLEFAFTQAPPSMQGLLTGLFLMTSGIGSFVSSAILKIVEAATTADPWFPDDINNGKAEYLFFLLGGLMLVNFFGFLLVARWYKYLPPPSRDDTGPDQVEGADNNGYTITYDEKDVVNTKF
ncbi:solute carrier family 15 member 4-like isoform X2 [Haliotis rufescens]|uniref:solute carrier family 15 member 4-like isoform X2 n=1 Tax=Haliotis rufescens TaxID=6454 RepID=UPI001EAFCB92|nr:solute carrier family 15 member 4-like isoform X2 [Haliotis rufescens]